MDDKKKVKDINAAVDQLNQHFSDCCIDKTAAENALKNLEAIEPHESVDEILSIETPTYFKFGVHTTTHGREFYALPCELSDEAFFDDASKDAMQRQLDNRETELNNLDMSYLETGILRKWSLDDAQWIGAQDEYKVTSTQNFSFVPREVFNDLFMKDLQNHADKNNIEVSDIFIEEDIIEAARKSVDEQTGLSRNYPQTMDIE